MTESSGSRQCWAPFTDDDDEQINQLEDVRCPKCDASSFVASDMFDVAFTV